MIGVPPHPLPWPEDTRLDPELLAHGDQRNVVDQYRYWTMDAVISDLRTRSHSFHVAIENFQHDFNIGTVVRTANAFLAGGVPIGGKRSWTGRGAIMTEQYLAVHHHPDVPTFLEWAKGASLPIVVVDNVPGAEAIETAALPGPCVLVFGQEGPGVSDEMCAAASTTVGITQFGSTRSINAGVAAGIVMHRWICQHADLTQGVI